MNYNPHMLVKVRSKLIMQEMASFPRCSLQLASFIPGRTCSGNNTLVGCHLPTLGKGFNTKVTDMSVACGCGVCHDILDGRDPKARDYIMEKYPAAINERMLLGLVETHSVLVDRGIITVEGAELI